MRKQFVPVLLFFPSPLPASKENSASPKAPGSCSPSHPRIPSFPLFFPPSSTVSPLVPYFWAEGKPRRAAAPYCGSCEMWAEPPSGGLPGRGPHICPAHSHPRGCPGKGSSFSIFKMALLCQDLGSALFPGPWAPSSPRGMCACTCACVSVCVQIPTSIAGACALAPKS